MKSDNVISGLEGAQQLPSGKGHLYAEIGNFVLELCKGHHSKSTAHQDNCCGAVVHLRPVCRNLFAINYRRKTVDFVLGAKIA